MLEMFVKGKMLVNELQEVLDSNDSRLNIKLSALMTLFHKNIFEKADTELKLNAIEILEETIQDIKKASVKMKSARIVAKYILRVLKLWIC